MTSVGTETARSSGRQSYPSPRSFAATAAPVALADRGGENIAASDASANQAAYMARE